MGNPLFIGVKYSCEYGKRGEFGQIGCSFVTVRFVGEALAREQVMAIDGLEMFYEQCGAFTIKPKVQEVTQRG